MRDFIAVLDFGSQYSHLISKRLRSLGVYSQIFHPSISEKLLFESKGIVLSGGPSSVYSENIPTFNSKILELDIPILGLCYGHQLIAKEFGGKIKSVGKGEFGKSILHKTADFKLWKSVTFPNQVWMSHRDSVIKCPDDFQITGVTDTGCIAAMGHLNRPIFCLQFHPEVKDSKQGEQILKNFVDLCKVKIFWSMDNFVDEKIKFIRQKVGRRKVLMFLSGGVDSSVTFALLNLALGEDRVLGLFIDNGFLRKNEGKIIINRYKELGFKNIYSRNYSRFFLKALVNQVDPQKKRELIGETFLKMRDKFLEELNLISSEWMLGQGTLYPDIIESGGTENSEIIKSHHNRVKEVIDLFNSGFVVEPLNDLYKDEVRKVGKLLGLPNSIVMRHPFPGPGLSINILCSRGGENFNDLQKISKEVYNCLSDVEFESKILPVKTVGVQGDQRTYSYPVSLQNVPRDWDWLEKESIRLTNQVRDVNRVVLHLGSKNKDVKAPFVVREAYCNKYRLDLLREVDFLTNKMLEENDLMSKIFQLLVILLPISKDGYSDSIVIRPVISEDVMTAKFARLDWELLDCLLKSILGIVEIETVFYDITHKPPGTFGWE